MKNLLRIVALLCACLMLLGAFVSCKKKEEPEAETSEIVSETESQTEVITLNDADTLREHDFGRADFNILAREATLYEYDIEYSANSSKVDLQIYERTRTIEDRFNVRIRVTPVACNDNDRKDFTTKLATSISSGASPWHMCSGHGTVISPQQFQGHCVDLLTLPEFDVKKEWWSAEFYNECNFGGRLFFAMGDIAYTMYEYMEVLFVNETQYKAKNVGGDGDVDALYDLVRDGDWTYETFKGYCMNYATNSSSVDEADRDYGFITNGHNERAFVPATETNFTYRDETSGEITLYETPTQKMSDFFEDLKGFIMDNSGDSGNCNVYLNSLTNDGATKGNALFTTGKGLFYGQQLGQAAYFGDMKDAYGVVPMPKYDELQENYHTTLRNSASAIMVPSNVVESAHEMTGVVIEALCMYGYQKVVPEYYDETLSNRVMNSADCVEMLKLIRESFMIDFSLAYTFGFVNNVEKGTHPHAVLASYLSSDGEFTSTWANNYQKLNGALQSMNDNVEKFYG